MCNYTILPSIAVFTQEENAASPLLVGVFNGAHYVAASTSKPTWANSFDVGTTVAIDYNTG